MKRRALLALIGHVFATSGTWRALDEIEARRKDRTKGPATDRWKRKRIAVIDYTGPELDGYLPMVVQNWNAALGGGIRLTYQRAEMRVDCERVQKRPGAIVICNFRTSNESVGTGATYVYVNKKSAIVAAKVQLVARAWGTSSEESGYWWHPLGCHELGHALGLEHDFNESRTCMGTQRQTPGWMDVRRLQALYGGCGGTITGLTPACCGELPQAAVTAEGKKCRKKNRK